MHFMIVCYVWAPIAFLRAVHGINELFVCFFRLTPVRCPDRHFDVTHSASRQGFRVRVGCRTRGECSCS